MTLDEEMVSWAKDINSWTARFAGSIETHPAEVYRGFTDCCYADRKTWDDVPILDSLFFLLADGSWRPFLDSSERDEIITQIMANREE